MAIDGGDSDAVVGCIAGLSLQQIAPWLSSLERSGFRGRRFLIHLDSDAQLVTELDRRGYETYDASFLHGSANSLKENPLPDEISVNRFYYIWHFLSRMAGAPNGIRYLIATDVRDVIFQRNPSDWLERHMGRTRLLAGTESLRFEDEPWGAQTMQDCFGPQVWDEYRHKLIYNAGTIAGEFRTLVDLALQIYLVAPGDRVLYSDQAALNLLLGSAIYREVTCFASSEDGWACQAGTTADPNLLQKVRHRLLCPAPCFDGEYVRTAAGEIFTLVHQYDRVPEWSAPLKTKYAI
jgi:hypothetical protein